MENGDDLLRIFLSKRSLLNNESSENLPSSRKSSARTYRMGETKELHTANGYVTYSDSEAEKLIQYHNLSLTRINESQNGYVVRPSSDGSFKYISRSETSTIHDTQIQININTIEKLNLGECNSTVTTDSIDSVNSANHNERSGDEDHFSLDSFNECYPKQIINTRQKSKRRISPIDEISENSMNSAKLKEYFAQKELESLNEEKEIQRIILEAQKLSASRPVSRKQSNYDFLRTANGPQSCHKVQPNNYILFYNEYFETSSAQGDNPSEHSIDRDTTSCSSSGKDDGTTSELWRPHESRSNLLEMDELNISIASSSPSCCCVKLFKSWFCKTGRTSRKASGKNIQSCNSKETSSKNVSFGKKAI